MKLQSLIDKKRREYSKKKKLMKRKVFFLKAKIFLTCVLPVVVILLAVKVIQTLVRMEVRKAATGAADKNKDEDKKVKKGAKRKPVIQKWEKTEVVKPVPVESDGKEGD